MIKTWEPVIPKVRNLRPVWINILEFLYTSNKDEFTTVEVCEEVERNFPDASRQAVINASSNVRAYLLKNGIVNCRKIKFRNGSGGSFQMVTSLINRDRIVDVLKLIKTPKQGRVTVAVAAKPKVSTPRAPVIPDLLTTRSERVIAALYKRCLEYKQEVAELVDELSECRASVHDATRKVNATTEAIRRSEKVASEIDLAEVGINLEE